MPEATIPTKSKRRLVPDLSDTIEVGGEKLARVVRVAPVAGSEDGSADPDLELRSIDDVARKHLGSDPVRVIEENSEFLQALSREGTSDETLPIDHIAGRIELFSEGSSAVPPAEPDPKKRDGMTISPIVGLDEGTDFLSGKEPPETLLDLFELFPQLDGMNWFIYVERKLPRIHSGVNAAGVVRKITRPLSFDDWQQIYGGGTYKLIVYGPPKRGSVMNEDGRFSPKKLTEPIIVTFPGPPSFECMSDLEDTMTQPMTDLPRRGPATMADANIETKRIDVSASRELRQEQANEAERKKNELLLKQKADSDSALLVKLLDLQRESSQREAELREKMLDHEREHAEKMRLSDEKWEARIQTLIGENKPDDIERLVRLSGVIKKDDGAVDAIRAEHQREIERLQRVIADEAGRNDQRVKDERERADRRIEEERRRVSDIEKNTQEREREFRIRADAEIEKARAEAERRINELHRQHETRVSDLDRTHQRDLAAAKEQHALALAAAKDQHVMAIDTQKQTYEMRLENSKGEIKRTLSEAERYKQEAEENKDVVGKITKLKEDAAALGMVDASEASGAEPETWQQMALKTGAGLLQNLPGVIENIANLARGRNTQDLQAARVQGRRDMIEQANQPMALPPPHRRRGPPQLGGGEFFPRHMNEVTPAPRVTSGDPLVVPPQPTEPISMPQPVFRDHPTSPSYMPGPAAMGIPPEPQMQPLAPVRAVAPPSEAPSIAPPAVAPGVPSAAEAEAIQQDRQMLDAVPILQSQYEANVPPPILAQQALEQLGPEALANLLQALGSADRFILALQRSGNPNSPLLRRDGKKFLRGIFEELRKVIGG